MATWTSTHDRISEVMRVEHYFPPADPKDVDDVERELGVQFPDWLRRIYMAADGFVGPTGVQYLYRLKEGDGVLGFNQFLRQEW
jgi:cell wall assembly regulator SMI1